MNNMTVVLSHDEELTKLIGKIVDVQNMRYVGVDEWDMIEGLAAEIIQVALQAKSDLESTEDPFGHEEAMAATGQI